MYFFFYLENREKELSFCTCRFSHTSDQPVDPTNRFVQGIPAFDPWNHFRAEFTSFRFWGAKEYYFRCQGLLPVNREQVSIERKPLQKSGIGLEQHQKASRKGECSTPGLVQTGCLFLGLQSWRTWTVRKRCRWAEKPSHGTCSQWEGHQQECCHVWCSPVYEKSVGNHHQWQRCQFTWGKDLAFEYEMSWSQKTGLWTILRRV